MKKIITLTVNPALDISTTVGGLRAGSKLRCEPPMYNAGGGGINVSRAIKKLGGNSRCLYLAGGPAGKYLHQLLSREKISQQYLPIDGVTRENFSVLDSANQQQYRFVMPGPTVQKREWTKILTEIGKALAKDDVLVASGSLSPGMPEDFYARVAILARKKGARLVLDTSGPPLLKGAKAGVFLLKPNLHELAMLCGVKSIAPEELEIMARKFLRDGSCEVLIVSMGARGAMLITQDLTEHIPAPPAHQKSTIGAGDSMVAGIVFMLKKGRSIREAARYGVACGTAATMSPGTQLCKKKDADRLYQWLVATMEK